MNKNRQSNKKRQLKSRCQQKGLARKGLNKKNNLKLREIKKKIEHKNRAYMNKINKIFQ